MVILTGSAGGFSFAALNSRLFGGLFCGLFSGLFLGSAASSQAQNHDQSQQHCQNLLELFHSISSLLLPMGQIRNGPEILMTSSAEKFRTLFHVLIITTFVFVVNVKTPLRVYFSRIDHRLSAFFVKLTEYLLPISEARSLPHFLTIIRKWDIIKLHSRNPHKIKIWRWQNGCI